MLGGKQKIKSSKGVKNEKSSSKMHVLDLRKVHESSKPAKSNRHRIFRKEIKIATPQDSAYYKTAENYDINGDKEQLDIYKKRIMWGGVAFFMLLIIFLFCRNFSGKFIESFINTGLLLLCNGKISYS